METRKLYDENPYETCFEARVISCEACEISDTEKGHYTAYQVILDQTLFFPKEGGQTPDVGELWRLCVEGTVTQRDRLQVLDVQIKKNVITHILEKPLEVGAAVQGEIDWKHRFSNMQQHSGEHIFSGLAYKKYGYLNVGFHLSNQIVTMDFNGSFTKEELEEMEWLVNEAIAKNVRVNAGYPSKEELSQMEYRSKKELEGAIRIVEIEGYDVCACCAPHVGRTGEIGGFKILYAQNYKGGTRISYLCGFRALEEFRKKSRIITDLSTILTTNQELLPENVTKLKNQVQNLKSQLAVASQTIMEHKIEGIPEEEENVILFEPELEALVARNIVNCLVEKHEGVCGIFIGNEEAGYSYILGSKSENCKAVAEKLGKELGARGGGSPQMVQGSLQAKKSEILGVIGE